METKDILGLLGGLALFLYGMKMMSDGLLDGAGIKLEYILEKLTNHKLKAILVGTLITCIIQSSSAMTVMLIGFVNAKVMKLNRAIWVIMGANIGTTMTGQLIAFDRCFCTCICYCRGYSDCLFLMACSSFMWRSFDWNRDVVYGIRNDVTINDTFTVI